MKAWLLHSLGGLENVQLGEIPEPGAGVGEVVLEVIYAGLNPADRYLAEGQYPARPPLPHVLGRDGIGVVTRVGEGVTGVNVGDQAVILRSEVGVNRAGTFAEKVAVPVESLVRVPVGWSLQQASVTLVYLTAYQALTMWGELPPSVVLVTGASGGVGVASVQLGSAMGHKVIALSRSEKKRKTLLKLGAGAAFDPQDPKWRRKVADYSPSGSVDLAIDNIGGELLPEVIHTLGENGKVSLVGRLAGPVPQFNTATLFFRRIKMGGVAVGAYNREEAQNAWQNTLKYLSKTRQKPLVDHVFPFDQLHVAFARLAEGPMGKVLLAVMGE